MTPSALPYAGGFHIYLPHSFQEAAFWVYAIPSFITLGPWVGKPQRVISITFFFERGYHAFLAGGLGDPEKTIRYYPLLGVIASSKSLRLLIGLHSYTALITALQFCGHWETTALYPEEQQYSRDAWEYTALRDT